MSTATPAPRWAEYQPIAQLRPALRNSKAHDQGALGASVQAFGFIEPVVVDERTGLLLAGHGRTKHLGDLQAGGAEPPDGVVVAGDGQWQVLVVRGVASRDDAHAEAMGIALNRVGERGGWQTDVLMDALDDLRLAPDLFDATGFTPEYLDDLVAGMRVPTLDELEGQHGNPDPTHLWPVLRFKVPPTARDRYLRLVEGVEGGDDVLFAHLLELAERP